MEIDHPMNVHLKIHVICLGFFSIYWPNPCTDFCWDCQALEIVSSILINYLVLDFHFNYILMLPGLYFEFLGSLEKLLVSCIYYIIQLFIWSHWYCLGIILCVMLMSTISKNCYYHNNEFDTEQKRILISFCCMWKLNEWKRNLQPYIRHHCSYLITTSDYPLCSAQFTQSKLWKLRAR